MKSLRRLKTGYRNIFILLYGLQLMIVVIFINNNYLQKQGLFLTDSGVYADIWAGIVILVLNCISIVVIRKFLRQSLKTHEDNLNRLKLEHILQENKLHRQNRHNLKNHLTVIYELAAAAEQEKLQKYLDHYMTRLKQEAIPVNTGLKEMDALIFNKLADARKLSLQVEFSCTACLRCDNEHVLDMVSIAGNILDNALEASQQAGQKIAVTFGEDPIDYTIKVTNSFKKGQDLDLNNLFQEGYSTKGQEGRGYGLTMVKEGVKKLEGELTVKVEEDLFSIEITLPKHVLEGEDVGFRTDSA